VVATFVSTIGTVDTGAEGVHMRASRTDTEEANGTEVLVTH